MKDEDARSLLERERRRIEEDLRNVAADPDNSKPDLGLDPGDQGSELFVEERDEGRREELERELAAVERAEERLAAGRYGLSVQSGAPIPDARLEAIPWAELTLEEEEQAERR